MPHPDAPAVIVGTRAYIEQMQEWWGQARNGPIAPPDPPPSLEERAARCREMGLVLCTCTGIDRNDEPRLLIYDPNCEVHGKVWKVA